MPLVSMKLPDSVNDAPEPSSYGYGLMLCLTEEQVEALGLKDNPPGAGATVGIRAMATVVRITQEADADAEAAEGEDAADVDVSLQLQITDLEVTTGGSTAQSAAASLYGGNND